MTDIQKFIELYHKIGVELTPEEVANSTDQALRIMYISDEGPIHGSADITTYLFFDEDGKFKGQLLDHD